MSRPPDGGSRFAPAERRVMVGAVVGSSLVPLNSTMIAVGLPDVALDLGVAMATAAWLVTTYLVAMALCQPVAGRLGDRAGSRPVTLVAMAGFGGAALLAAAAPSFGLLLVARVVQAVFGAALIPNLQAIVRVAVAAGRRGRAFGILASGTGAGAAAGPVLGGVLVDLGDWRWIFIVNVPIVLAAIALVARAGQVVAAAETEPQAGAGAGGAPVDGRPLRQRPFLVACVAQGTSNLTMYSVLLVVPLVLAARGWTSSATGLVLLGLTAGMVVLAPLGGAVGDRRGRRFPVVAGMAAIAAGAALLTAVGDTAPPGIVVGVVLVGIGLGIAGASLHAAALESVPVAMSGSAAGIFSTTRYAGSITGSLAIAALVENGTGVRPVLGLATVAAVVALAAATRLAERPGPAPAGAEPPPSATGPWVGPGH